MPHPGSRIMPMSPSAWQTTRLEKVGCLAQCQSVNALMTLSPAPASSQITSRYRKLKHQTKTCWPSAQAKQKPSEEHFFDSSHTRLRRPRAGANALNKTVDAFGFLPFSAYSMRRLASGKAIVPLLLSPQATHKSSRTHSSVTARNLRLISATASFSVKAAGNP